MLSASEVQMAVNGASCLPMRIGVSFLRRPFELFGARLSRGLGRHRLALVIVTLNLFQGPSGRERGAIDSCAALSPWGLAATVRRPACSGAGGAMDAETSS